MNPKYTAVNVKRDVHHQVKVIAARERRAISEVVKVAIAEYAKKYGHELEKGAT
jgi:hypothetical protein